MKYVQNREKNCIIFTKPLEEDREIFIKFRGGWVRSIKLAAGREVVALPINRKVIKLWTKPCNIATNVISKSKGWRGILVYVFRVILIVRFVLRQAYKLLKKKLKNIAQRITGSKAQKESLETTTKT